MSPRTRRANADPFVAAPREPEVVVLPPARYIVVEGKGAPESKEFQAAIGALYRVAYTMKFAAKRAGGADFKVAPLEAIWWAPAQPAGFDPQRTPRERWRWKAMIRVPEQVTDEAVSAARHAVEERRGDRTAWRVTLETIEEGRVVQALHVGPYATEPATIAKMREVMSAQRLLPRGYHHEIYLGDPRRAKPDKLKTILRQPVDVA